MVEAASDMLWEMDAEGEPTYLSPRFQSYFGVSMHALRQRGWLSFVAPADRARVLRSWKRSLRTGQKIEMEVRLPRFDGVLRWFAVRLVPLRDEAGRVGARIGGCTDIHDLKRSEQALKRSNSELKQFAYAAAHDLQEPLRNVATSLGMLRRQYSEQLDARGNDWIDASVEGAQRLHEMVKDLLLFSTIIDSRPELAGHTDGSAALRTALAHLAVAIEECAPALEICDLPALAVEQEHAVQLFEQLLSNALKYRQAGSPCSIAISAVTGGSECRISIRDNGIGFDPAYAGFIFRIFKRLHSRTAYPGNGIGLAICERIVSHYGGRIWAESSPGEGATFHFTLPVCRMSDD